MKTWRTWFALPATIIPSFMLVRRLERAQNVLEKKLVFLREISALSNPSFGIDCTVGVVMEQLRSFYGADCCLLVSGDVNEGHSYLRRVDGLDPEGATRKSPLAPKLAGLFLWLPTNVAAIQNTRKNRPEAPHLQCYDVVSNQKVSAPAPPNAKLLGLLEANSFICVPLLHHGLDLGRLFLTSDERTFDQSDVEFIHQIVGYIVPLLKNMELVEHLVSDAAGEERLRIARDIHDSIVQPYIGLQMGIESLRRKVEMGKNELLQKQLLSDIERLNNLCISGTLELRSYVQQLKESREDEESLLSATKRLTAKFEAATGIRVYIETEAEIYVPPRLAAEILQMVSEGLSNIRRHTHSEAATIRLMSRDGYFTLIIENHNRNIIPSATRRDDQYGIPGVESCSFTPVSLSERTWSLGGYIEVEVCKQGATVTIRIPL